VTELVYLLVDGENIDRTLGQILGVKPKPEQRPRWNRIKDFVEKKYQAECRPLFFLNANEGLPGTFVQALISAQYVPVLLKGPGKVVDDGINKTLLALSEKLRENSAVCLVSHDADFSEGMQSLAETYELSVLGFQEFVSGDLLKISGLKIMDLETEVKAFDCTALPRLRTVDISEFDPNEYL